MMAAFCAAILFLGPGFLLTGAYLGLAMGVLALIAQFRKESTFGSLLKNNNWVFLATAEMTLLSGIMTYLNPLVPDDGGWISGIGSWLGSWLSGEKEFSDSALWGAVNYFFFGEAFTYGWQDATMAYGLWSIPAAFVSFWDELFRFFGKIFSHLAKGKGMTGFAVRDATMELVWGILKKITGR